MTNENINTFSTALRARHADAIAKDKLSDKNRKSLVTFANEIDNADAIVAFLTTASLDPATFENDVYEIDKVRNLTLLLTDKISLRDFNEMTRLVFLTAINFELSDIAMERQDAYNACSAHCKISDAKKRKLTVQNKEAKSDSTCTAQHRSSLAALENLNIIRAINKREYRVNLDSDATKALAAKLNVEIATQE